MDAIWNKIEAIADHSGGIVSTKQVEESGISRVHLKEYVDAGLLVRTCRGKYLLSSTVTDEYALLQSQNAKAVFSYGTALYLWGMSDRVPNIIDITVPQGINVSRMKRDYPDIRFHYVQPDAHEIGVTRLSTAQGNPVRAYDKERCICDLIRARRTTDLQLYSQAIKEYFANKPNPRKLLKYGKRFGIEDKIRIYTEVLL